MQASTYTHQTPDGHALHVYLWTPEDTASTRGVVHVVHGLAEHAARYERLAQHLTDAGWVVVANDHRGHGQSVQADSLLGFFAMHDGWRLMIDDLVDLVRPVRERFPDGPLVRLGHSMGSSLVLGMLGLCPAEADAAILTGPVGRPGAIRHAGRGIAAFEAWRQGAYGRSKVLDFLTFGDFNKPFEPARTSFDWLSRDAAEVDAYVADDRCGFIATNRLWQDVLAGIELYLTPDHQRAIRSDLPMLMLAGAMDPVGGRGAQVRTYADELRAHGLSDFTLKLYDDARHELFNETNREEVIADVTSFLDRL